MTDDESNLRWVALNQQITLGQQLQEAAQEGDQRAQAALQELIDDPRLNEVVEVRNNTTELDVDISIAQGPDYATIQQEQFETMANLAQTYGPEAVPFEVMLELSGMSHKDRVKEMLNPQEEEVDPQVRQAQQQMVAEVATMEFETAEAELEGKRLDNIKKQTDIEQQAVETDRLARTPPDSVNVSV